MTLIELMVAIAVGMIVIGAVVAMYANLKQVTRVDETVTRVQENGRFALYLLDRDVRMASFRGCISGAGAPLNVLASTAYPYQFETGIAGYHAVGPSWSPALDASIAGLSPAPAAGSDIVTVRLIDGPGVSLTARMAGTAEVLQVAAGSPIAAGDLLLVADCEAAAIFQATAFDAASGAISHAAANGAVPGNSSADLGHLYGTDAIVFRLVTRTYYVAPSALKPGTTSLWSYSVPNYDAVPQPSEMAEGVERIALSFGEDTDGDAAANRYVTADLVGNWRNVVSAKPEAVIATTSDYMATSPQPYTFEGRVVTPADRRLRSVMTSVITLRNRVP